ncbi:ubiquitin ligase complex F-box protein GRR1 [Cordyceps javanica]|uniref:Ubiquitin ligase complex F-box protein GRR1 n=1 Tax=Cordyceps javanica TaxID=43265 RepID=A0A545UQ10_9HYPO|nr:ubiquitin ligase complex F-box protein GRR1 [Cordyceps javanica]TQW03663.1 ubiquitin ligase complex F-box protein GRR1 [Cordyceps javanica]
MRPAVAPPLETEASRSAAASDQDDSRSSSSDSPAPADNEESDFFLGANDSQSSIGVVNFQDMHVEDRCWPPISRLPNEILIAIFAKLGTPSDLRNCMLVSKRWTRNAVDLLWHRPACTSWKSHQNICQTLESPKPFFNYRDFIKRLNLAALADRISDGSVTSLYVCTRIERLTLTNCRGLTDAGIIGLVENNTNLLALDVSNDKNITDQSIYTIAEHCKRLQGLNISGCDNVSNESMEVLAKSCKYIKRLKLNDCTQIRDAAVLAFAENCPNILEIDLNQCGHVGNGAVTALMAQGTCLRELRLAFCSLVDDYAFLALPPTQMFDHLRILDLTCCTRLTDIGVKKIIDVAPRLRNLVLAKCRLITDSSLSYIAKLGKNLHYLHLGHCANITDEGVKTLVTHCNRIRYIDLGCCTNLTDESVKRLAVLPKLKRIGLVKCNSITDESIYTLAEIATRPRVRRDANGLFIGGEYYSSNLERIHLSYCSILKLLNSCPRLSHLSLTGVPAFQGDEFLPFCREAPPEFTNHQRNVFCVFSGNQVSRFRDHLNTAPQFEDLRESLLPRRPHPRTRQVSNQIHPVTASALPATFEETYDDEMGDDNDDFEGIYPNDMAQNAQPNNGFVGTGFQGTLPSMAHSLPTLPGIDTLPWDLPNALAVDGTGFHPGSFAAQQHAQGHQPQQQGSLASHQYTPGYQNQQMPLPTLASLIGTQGAYGHAPMSAFGVSQASMAGPASTAPGQASTASAASATGASTAQMHHDADADERENMTG